MTTIKAQNLVCPIDGKKLIQDEGQLRCENSHTFDIARQGYVNLLPVQYKRSKHPGDSKEMVIARTEFLNSGLYEPIARYLIELCSQQIKDNKNVCILDAGCGEGYYLDFIQQGLKEAVAGCNVSYIGLDISKPAILACAKRNKTISWIVGTNRQPPIEEGSVDIIICVFGFQNYDGFSKLLKSGGVIILVEPGPSHLMELKKIIYADDRQSSAKKEDELEGSDFSVIDSHSLQFSSGVINNQQITNLLLMTPHLFRASRDGKQKAAQLQALELSVDVVFTVLEKK